jgi:hypothetical protein
MVLMSVMRILLLLVINHLLHNVVMMGWSSHHEHLIFNNCSISATINLSLVERPAYMTKFEAASLKFIFGYMFILVNLQQQQSYAVDVERPFPLPQMRSTFEAEQW